MTKKRLPDGARLGPTIFRGKKAFPLEIADLYFIFIQVNTGDPSRVHSSGPTKLYLFSEKGN